MATFDVHVRPSGTSLAAAHQEILAGGRWQPIDWSGIGPFPEPVRLAGAASWTRRMVDEYRSTTLFSQLQTLLLLANLPLDVMGAMARVVADEVRHVQLCADAVTALGGAPSGAIEAESAYLLVDPAAGMRPQLLAAAMNLLCLGETVSARLIGATHQGTRCAPFKEVLRRLHADEVFHGEFGWQLVGLLLVDASPEERAALAAMLPTSLRQLEAVCTTYGDAPEELAEADRALGSLSVREHREAFHRAVDEAVLPRLEALGLPGREAWAGR
ncbi:MAG: hypothetical protein JWM80_3621 [Cyanobacteria bacterium RYN_339]|nr:hypothetical protein [Cyanobacteria bacterium RYN_339]